MFIAALCGGAAWTAEVTIVRRVQPPSQPPPAGGRRRVPAPSRGGLGRGPSPCPRSRAAGGTPALPGHVHRAVCAPRMGPNVNISSRGGGWGNRVSPSPSPREGLALKQGCGVTRVPHTPGGGRPWRLPPTGGGWEGGRATRGASCARYCHQPYGQFGIPDGMLNLHKPPGVEERARRYAIPPGATPHDLWYHEADAGPWRPVPVARGAALRPSPQRDPQAAQRNHVKQYHGGP